MPSSSCSTSSARLLLAGFTALVCVGCKSSAPVPASDEVTARRQEHMSTYVTITVAAPESKRVLAAIDAAFAEIVRLESLLSEWRPGSEISAVNKAAGQRAVPVGKELFAVISAADGVARATNGAFDITVQAFSGLWNFRSMGPQPPAEAAIAERLPLVDYRQVELQPDALAVMLRKQDMSMGLGGIAKGYAVDGASRVLKQRGFLNHLIVAGGDLYASGRKKSRRWNIGVRSPTGKGIYATLEVEDQGVATSGNYERFFVYEGVRYHHILNPKTGKPARGVSSSTVVAPSALLADAYATALLVLGMDAGMQIASSRPDLEALLFDDQSHTPRATPGVEARLQVHEDVRGPEGATEAP